MRIIKVRELVEEILKLDQDRYILIGDHDEYGRKDLLIGTIVQKHCGFDDDKDFYYVIIPDQHIEGCLKY